MIQNLLNKIAFVLSGFFLTLSRLMSDFWVVITASIAYGASILYIEKESIWLFIFFIALALYGIRQGIKTFRLPHKKNIEREIEKENHLPIGTLETLKDEKALGNKNYWNNAITHIKKSIPLLSIPFIKTHTAQKDPFALRFIALLFFIVGLITTFPNSSKTLKDHFFPKLYDEAWFLDAPTTYTGWITPPQYTEDPAVLLNEKTVQPITVLAGSQLEISLTSSDNSSLFIQKNNDQTAIELTKSDSSDFHFKDSLTKDDFFIKIYDEGKKEIISWSLLTEEDQAPEIHFLTPPEENKNTLISLSYIVQDDYLPKNVFLDITPLQSSALYPNPQTFTIEMPIGIKTQQEMDSFWENTLLYDFSNYSFSGMPVEMSLRVIDQLDQNGETEKVQITIPEKIFKNVTAKEIIKIRTSLIQNYKDHQENALKRLEYILIRPGLYNNQAEIFLSLKAALTRLYLDYQRNQELKSIASLLWYIAINIEDGALIEEEKKLQKLQQKLAKLLNEKNFSQQEVSQLIDDIEKSLREYAQASLKNLLQKLKNGDNIDDIKNLQTALIDQDKTSNYLQKMRDLISEGKTAEAMQMLQELQNMLTSMKAPKPKLTPEQENAIAAYKDLQKIITKQETLLETAKTTFTRPDSKDKNLKIKELEKQQTSLKNTLEKTLKKLEKLSPESSFKQCKNASDNMSNASNALKAMDDTKTQEEQQKAIQNLKNTLEEAKQAFKDSLNLEINDTPNPLMSTLFPSPKNQQGFSPQDSRLDPFGKQPKENLDDKITLENKNYQERVRAIVNELQKRSSETNRPHKELDYIKRLLERF